MKSCFPTVALIALPLALAPAQAADDNVLTRLATCQDSWLDWQKSDPGKLKTFGEHFRASFAHSTKDPFFVPKNDESVAGLRVVEAFPESVGMGVGFSLTLDAPFDRARAAMEKTLGKKVGKCETGDGMKMCELKTAEQRTFTLMAGDTPKAAQTLVGCYYFYEK
jgi:hypothetical protein